MSTKKSSQNSSSLALPPAGILRRSTTNSGRSNMNYPNETLHDAKLRRHEYDLQASAYPNVDYPEATAYRLSNQYYYSNRDNVEEYEDSVGEEVMQAENDLVVDDPNQIVKGRVQSHVDDKVEYVKGPQIESEVLNKGKVTTAALSKETARLSGANLPNYDSRIEHNVGGMGTGTAPIYGSHLDMGEAYYNYYNAYTQAQMKKLGYQYQNSDSSKMPTSCSYPSPDKNSEAWAKRSELSKKLPTSRSPTRQESTKPSKQRECVGAEDSTTIETINYILGEMEFNEMSKIKKDLRDFQKARRRLVYDATSIKPIIPLNSLEKDMLDKK